MPKICAQILALLMLQVFAVGPSFALTKAEFVHHGSLIPARLVNYQSDIGSVLDLQEFAAKMSTYDFVSARVHGTREHMCRASAFWEMHNKKTGRPTVTVDPYDWKDRWDDERDVLACHEYAGLENLNDDSLFLCMSMWLLSLDPDKQMFSAEQRQQILKILRANAGVVEVGMDVGGGVTGTGGGGEGSTVASKMVPIAIALNFLFPDQMTNTDHALIRAANSKRMKMFALGPKDPEDAWDEILTALTRDRNVFRDLKCLMGDR